MPFVHALKGRVLTSRKDQKLFQEESNSYLFEIVERKILFSWQKIRSFEVDKEKTECANIQGYEKLQPAQNVQLCRRYGKSSACDRRWG